MKITPNTKWVLDSNILIYSFDEDSPFFAKTKELYTFIITNSIIPVVALQNITELVNVLHNFYKLDKKNIINRIETVLKELSFEIIAPKQNTLEIFFYLLEKYDAHSHIYDTFLTATIIDNNRRNLFTNNIKDFEIFKELTVVNPYK